MSPLTQYFYYSNHDSKKEAIDRVYAITKEDAITYFSNRKKMDIETFNKLYTVEIDERIQSK